MEPERDDQIFDARHASLPDTAAFVAAFCRRHSVASDDTLRITLVVEELFINIVLHGYGEDAGGRIRLALSCDGAEVVLVCEDQAGAYDPRPALERPPKELDAPLESRPVGGLGEIIIGHYARLAAYAREDGWNRLTLRFACERMPA